MLAEEGSDLLESFFVGPVMPSPLGSPVKNSEARDAVTWR